MTLKLERTTNQEQVLITDIMTAAFNDDRATYFGTGATDGPPGYDDGTLAKKVLADCELTTFIIVRRQVAVGFITLNLAKRELAYFCLKPQWIGQGIGTQVWQLIEERYDTNNWQLETPSYSRRNHSFYEKLGFIKSAEKNYPNGAVSYCYEKRS